MHPEVINTRGEKKEDYEWEREDHSQDRREAPVGE